MASISADIFKVVREEYPVIFYDYSRRHLTRRFILYVDGTADRQYVANGYIDTTGVKLPMKMALAMQHALYHHMLEKRAPRRPK